MTKKEFLNSLSNWSLWSYDHYDIDCKNAKLINAKSGKTEKYKSLDDLYENAILDGKPLKEIAAENTRQYLFSVVIDDSDIMLQTIDDDTKIN